MADKFQPSWGSTSESDGTYAGDTEMSPDKIRDYFQSKGADMQQVDHLLASCGGKQDEGPKPIFRGDRAGK